jgi:hypothetical protein
MEFDRERKRKWREGRRERGLDPAAPFEGDPAAELQNEALDIPNYAEVLLLDGDIDRDVAERLHAVSLDIYLLMEAVKARRAERLLGAV